MLAQESFTRKTALRASSHPQPSTTFLSRIFEAPPGNVDVAIGSVDSRDIMSRHLSGVEDAENEREQIFRATKLILNVGRVDTKISAEEALKFQSFTNLSLGDYDMYLNTIQRCNMLTANKTKDKCKYLHMGVRNVSSATESRRKNTFFPMLRIKSFCGNSFFLQIEQCLEHAWKAHRYLSLYTQNVVPCVWRFQKLSSKIHGSSFIFEITALINKASPSSL